MPNWCYNHIEINASPDAIKKLIQNAKAPASPQHKEIVEFSYLPFVKHLLPQNYEDEWYSSYREILGSKWFPDISIFDVDTDSLTLGFDSAWAPTTTGTEHIAQWLRSHTQGEFSIIHSYEEAGMAFCGVLTVSRSGSEEQYGDMLELYLDDPILQDEADTDEFLKQIDVSREQLREWIAEAEHEDYLRFIPEFYADHSRDEDILLPPPTLLESS